MATFLVLRQVSGLTRDQFAAAQQAVSEEARRVTTGRAVRFRGGFFVRSKGWAVCVFHAESVADVAAVNERAGVPFAEILEAIELRPREKPDQTRCNPKTSN